MAHSSLFGRRIHIAGSVDKDASPDDVLTAREFVSALVPELIRRGANFVVPVDAEPLRQPQGDQICFDWLIWSCLNDHLLKRPRTATGSLAIAVQHHKSEDQVPEKFQPLWDSLRRSSHVVIENAANWNMAVKRLEASARHGDILITLGGAEGVLHLANLYHDAGKPVVPLGFPLSAEKSGSRRLFSHGLSGNRDKQLFHMEGSADSHGWLNRISYLKRHSTADRVADLLELLEALERPRAFVVRLLNPDLKENKAVDNFFGSIVKPVVEGEMGYRLVVVDGQQPLDKARMDDEIFTKLHRSSVVLVDLTASRPNCFLELGYALGRGLPTLVMAKDGTALPFDIKSISSHFWKSTGLVEDRKRAFREHWAAVRDRPTLVSTELLIA
jgi:hypothetical protein